MSKNDKTNTAMFRTLINGIFNETSDQVTFGNSNAEILMEKFPIINACRGTFIVCLFQSKKCSTQNSIVYFKIDFMCNLRPDFSKEQLHKVVKHKNSYFEIL
jgi:hypothetical protein